MFKNVFVTIKKKAGGVGGSGIKLAVIKASPRKLLPAK